MSAAPHVAAAVRYAEDVRAGRIVACKWTVAAAVRFLSDLERADTDGFPYRLDTDAAEHACRFLEQLPHVKGRWETATLRLEPWQCFLFVNVFGWVHVVTGFRRFRTAYTEVPRKNGKSTPTAGVGLYMLAADGEDGAECYSAATTRDQAKIVWSVGKEMARRAPGLQRAFGVHVAAHNLHVVKTASKFEPLSAEANSLDGLNVHFAAIDELHAHKTREVYDVLETATGSRAQPLLWAITTAGSNRAGICYEVRSYLTKVLNGALQRWPGNPHRIEGGAVDAESFFGCIWTVDDGDDWTDPAVWAKANPNLGVSVFADDLERKCRKAQEMPSAQNNFLTKHLNVWVNADTAWMDMRAWDRCADPTLTPEDFEGEPCRVGLDLASTTDIAARMQLFERDGHYYAFGKYFLPEDTIERAGNSQYSGWEADGRLVSTEGNVLDYGAIEDDLRELSGRFRLLDVAFDPFQAVQLSTRMMAEGFPMIDVRPTVLNFSEPMKQLERLVFSGKFHHDGDPVLAWMVSNVVAHLDNKDNIYPRKERPENKIDGVVALLMALARALAAPQGEPSIYFL